MLSNPNRYIFSYSDSPLMSSYLFTFVIGNYDLIETVNENKTKLLKSDHSHINELDYKFEIIQYKKKLESLKNQKQEKINKITEMNQANNKIYENKTRLH